MLAAKEEKRELCRREWAERIAECESSNMSVREWCAANGVNVNTYYGRVAALKKDTAKTKKTSTQDIVPLSAVKEKPDVPSVVNSETVAVPIRTSVSWIQKGSIDKGIALHNNESQDQSIKNTQ